MKSRRATLRRALLALVASLSLLLVPATSSEAALDVYDYVNWALSYYQRYEQIRNQYKTIENEVRQVQQLAKALESFDQSDWSSFDASELEVLLAYGEHLGYLNSAATEIFDVTFPGYEAPRYWPDEFQARVSRTRSTLRRIQQSLRSLGNGGDYQSEILTLLQNRSDEADSPTEELETANMFHSLHSADMQRSIQASLLVGNAIAVSQAQELQFRASAEAARSSWLLSEPLPYPDSNQDEGFTALPNHWDLNLF